LQKALEERNLTPLSAAHEFICTTPAELGESQATEVMTLLDKLEQDDDVQNVYHTLA
jgi:transcriptional/translational regulatory protein YebC/TACO1